MKPGVLGGRKPNDINIHSREVTQLLHCSHDMGQNSLQNIRSSQRHLFKKKKQFSSARWKATTQESSISKAHTRSWCDPRSSQVTREDAHGSLNTQGAIMGTHDTWS